MPVLYKAAKVTWLEDSINNDIGSFNEEEHFSELSETPDSDKLRKQARGFGIYEFAAGVFDFTLINCHMNSNSSKADFADAVLQVESLAVAWFRGLPTIITGDFNVSQKLILDRIKVPVAINDNPTTIGGCNYDHIFYIPDNYDVSEDEINSNLTEGCIDNLIIVPIPTKRGHPTVRFSSDTISYLSDHNLVYTTIRFNLKK